MISTGSYGSYGSSAYGGRGRDDRSHITRLPTVEFVWFWGVFMTILACVTLAAIAAVILFHHLKLDRIERDAWKHEIAETVEEIEEKSKKAKSNLTSKASGKNNATRVKREVYLTENNTTVFIQNNCYLTVIARRQLLSAAPCGEGLKEIKISENTYAIVEKYTIETNYPTKLLVINLKEDTRLEYSEVPSMSVTEDYGTFAGYVVNRGRPIGGYYGNPRECGLNESSDFGLFCIILSGGGNYGICREKSFGNPIVKDGMLLGLLAKENNLCDVNRNLLVFLKVATYMN